MLSTAVDLQPAWVLHSRPYRESSLIVDLLTRDHGRVSVVINGARGSATKKGRPRKGQLMQPFTELLVSWQGKAELKTLKTVEQRRIYTLSGVRLFSGLYANELLQRLLQPWQALEGLPELYSWLLEQLTTDAHLERLLRIFEKHLLELLGYGLPLAFESPNGNPIQPDGWYHYQAEQGFHAIDAIHPSTRQKPFSGAMLLALAEDEIADHNLAASKALMREAIQPFLGGRPLRSRELFRPRS